jgi:D-alanine-D-alanine ligase
MSEPDRALSFPLIVKPVAEGSGKGIYQTSLVHAPSELRPAVASAMERFRQPVLIEQFLPGREFTVGLIANVGRWL